MTPRGTFELYCVYIAQLMTHTAIHTLPFALQLCYKPLGTLQKVTKSQKFHISIHDYSAVYELQSQELSYVIRSRFKLVRINKTFSHRKMIL